MRVLFFGLIKNVIGKEEEALPLEEGVTIRKVLHYLAERYGEEFRDNMMTAAGEPRQTVRLLVDGVNIDEGEGLDTKMGGAGVLSIIVMIPPMSGG